MQKALILALLIGAFLLPRYVTAQDVELPEYHCPSGGTLYPEITACGVPYDDTEIPFFRFSDSGISTSWHSSVHAAGGEYASLKTTENSPPCNNRTVWTYNGQVSDTHASFTFVRYRQYQRADGSCANSAGFPNSYTGDTPFQTQLQTPQCEHPFFMGPSEINGQLICYRDAEPLPDDEDPPPKCDIGDCNPPEEPKCFRGGNGQLVCFEDPNDKCDVQTVNQEPVYSNCQSGCGFVQDNFLCSEEPDIPSLDNCLVTTNGYACPADIPEPDDTIDNPEKPIDNMVKGDFKDVLLGVETRTDATNKLISDQIARDAENTEKLAVGLGKANQYLAAIDKNTKEIADGMEDLKGDGSSADLGTGAQFKAEIQNALGITGDETIEDLTVAEVSLDDFTDDFQWSLGPDQCPQPRAINMLGKTFYMDWGPFCEAFTVLGYLILAAAYFFATLIAFRGK